MPFLLDSVIISDIYDQNSAKHTQVIANLQALNGGLDKVLAISVLTIFELEYGFAHAPDTKKIHLRRVIETTKKRFMVLPLEMEIAAIFGEMKNRLITLRRINKENAKKHNIDLMLASTAFLYGYVIISDDAIYEELAKLYPQLRVENWRGA